MTINTVQEAAPYALGTAAIANPIWLQWLQPGYQIVLGVLGLVVIILTIRSKILEIRIKKNILEGHNKP